MGGAVSGLLGGDDGGAAKKAGKIQSRFAQDAIDQSTGNYAYIRDLLKPFVEGGNTSFGSSLDLLGLNGAGAEETAVNGIQNSGAFQAQKKLGEDALLQNASATGGLRGGNTELALSQYSPMLLQQFIQQRLGNLGNITNTGMQGVSGTIDAANSLNQTKVGLLGQQGAAQAGAALGQGQADNNGANQALQIAGTVAGAYF